MIYPATSLIGGASGSLDSIDGDILVDGDACMAVTDSGVYWYHLNATSSATENSPFRINPDTNPGTKSWHLVGTTARIGALVYKDATQSIATAAWTALSWNDESYDDAAFWSIGNPTRLTIPIGITVVKFVNNTYWATNSVNDRRARLYKNGTGEVIGGPFILYASEAEPALNCVSTNIDVSATDYFEIEVYQNSGGSLNIASTTSRIWFSIEAVGFA